MLEHIWILLVFSHLTLKWISLTDNCNFNHLIKGPKTLNVMLMHLKKKCQT